MTTQILLQADLSSAFPNHSRTPNSSMSLSTSCIHLRVSAFHAAPHPQASPYSTFLRGLPELGLNICPIHCSRALINSLTRSAFPYSSSAYLVLHTVCCYCTPLHRSFSNYTLYIAVCGCPISRSKVSSIYSYYFGTYIHTMSVVPCGLNLISFLSSTAC